MTVIAGLLAETDTNWDHMNGWGGGWMWLWGVAMMTLFVVLIVWLIRANDNAPRHDQTPGSMRRDPTERGQEILAERYAHGELSTEEYQERVRQLQ